MTGPDRDSEANEDLRLKIVIIADDLTGALDAAGHFATKGVKTILVMKPDWKTEAPVVACSTGSREDKPEIAAFKTKNAIEKFNGTILFKKIDSTLRGNLATELVSALQASRCRWALIAPAFPLYGRTTVGSIQLVDGFPVTEVMTGSKAVYSVISPHIPSVLSLATSLPIHCFGLEWVEDPPEHLAQEIKNTREPLLVFDAADEGHLINLAKAAWMVRKHALLCGSAGFASAIADAWDWSNVASGNLNPPTSVLKAPVLIVSGSRNPVTLSQVKHLLSIDETVQQVTAPPQSLLSGNRNEICHRVNQLILDGVHTVLAVSNTTPELLYASDEIVRSLGQVVRDILEKERPGTLVLTGGDTALAVCDCLDMVGLEVITELNRGIPLSLSIGGLVPNLPVVTKAGGFGSVEVFIDIIKLATNEEGRR